MRWPLQAVRYCIVMESVHAWDILHVEKRLEACSVARSALRVAPSKRTTETRRVVNSFGIRHIDSVTTDFQSVVLMLSGAKPNRSGMCKSSTAFHPNWEPRNSSMLNQSTDQYDAAASTSQLEVLSSHFDVR